MLFCIASLGRLWLDFLLDVSLAAIEPRNQEEKNGGDEHHLYEEEKIACSLQLQGAVRILDKEIDPGGEHVAEGHGAQVGAHDERLHFRGGLGISKLQMRHRYHDFGRRKYDEGQDLPDNARGLPCVNTRLNPADD